MAENEKLTARDRETFISYNDGERAAVCFTCSASLIRTLDRLCAENESVRCTRATCHGKTYKLPKEWVKFSPG